MFFGTDYYPEHVAESRWREDARLMREAGMNVVRLAEFAWSALEPREGAFDLEWLDAAIAVLAAEGMQIVLGTPTAAPPKWLVDKYPGMLPVDRFGRVGNFGGRRHYCSNNPDFRKRTVEVVRRLAEHYGQRPEIAAWQIDNELGGHDTVCCHCPECRRLFRLWLQDRYGCVEELNRRWGTVFWSQRYQSFDEVDPPLANVCEVTDGVSHGCNPSQAIDFQRFSSESVIGYQQLQIDEIRKYSAKPVTSNLMGHFPELDYFKLAESLDFVTWDNYPNSQWGGDPVSVSMAHDLMRGLNGQNFWVMEQQSGPCGWSALGDTPKPGQLRLYTWQAVAHGAEAVLYFPWRACPFGAEQYWYGVLDHDSVPRRRYFELKQAIGELRRLSQRIGPVRPSAEIAIIKSYDNLWSHRIQPHNRGFDYGRLLLDYYNAAVSSGHTVDVTGVGADIGKYKVVLLPAFNLTTPDIAEKLDGYVRHGGTLVLTFRSGTRNWDNTILPETIPGPFAAMAGIEVEEFDSLNFGRTVSVRSGGSMGTASMWCDVLKCASAETMAEYASDYYAGKPAVTKNSHGKGTVWYVGCDLDGAFLNALLSQILGSAGAVPALPGLPREAEAVAAESDGGKIVWVLNHAGAPAAIPLAREYTDLLTGRRAAGTLELEPYGVAALALSDGA